MKTMTPTSTPTDEMLSRRRAAMSGFTKPSATPPAHHQSIKETLAAHLSDPTHRFHAAGGSHDDRTNVAAGGALQRMRGRRH